MQEVNSRPSDPDRLLELLASRLAGNTLVTSDNKTKLTALFQLLKTEVVDLSQLKQIVMSGIPSQGKELRALCWSLILGALPAERAKWTAALSALHSLYQNYKSQFFHNQKRQKPSDIKTDTLLMEQIMKDCVRTWTDLTFFNRRTSQIQVFFPSKARYLRVLQIGIPNSQASAGDSYLFDHLAEILFIFAKTNGEVGYVQGMNEVLAPIFYVVNEGRSVMNQSLAFYLFATLSKNLLPLWRHSQDDERQGLLGRIALLKQSLAQVNPPLFKHFARLQIEPIFFAISWYITMYAQAFNLMDLIRLWDCLFSGSHELVEELQICALALLRYKCKQLLGLDYSKAITLLQNYFKSDVEKLIREIKRTSLELHDPAHGSKRKAVFRKLCSVFRQVIQR